VSVAFNGTPATFVQIGSDSTINAAVPKERQPARCRHDSRRHGDRLTADDRPARAGTATSLATTTPPAASPATKVSISAFTRASAPGDRRDRGNGFVRVTAVKLEVAPIPSSGDQNQDNGARKG
jgi:hypothetical protein